MNYWQQVGGFCSYVRSLLRKDWSSCFRAAISAAAWGVISERALVAATDNVAAPEPTAVWRAAPEEVGYQLWIKKTRGLVTTDLIVHWGHT